MSTYFPRSLSTTIAVLLFLFFLSLVPVRQEPSLQRLRCDPAALPWLGSHRPPFDRRRRRRRVAKPLTRRHHPPRHSPWRKPKRRKSYNEEAVDECCVHRFGGKHCAG